MSVQVAARVPFVQLFLKGMCQYRYDLTTYISQ